MSITDGLGIDTTLIVCDRCRVGVEYDTVSVDRAATFAEADGWSVWSNEVALCPACRLPDDEGEQIRRDAEIDARVSSAGELMEWEP